MPIDIGEFEGRHGEALDLGEETQPDRVVGFLAEHGDSAYTQSEVHEARGSSAAASGRCSPGSRTGVSCGTGGGNRAAAEEIVEAREGDGLDAASLAKIL